MPDHQLPKKLLFGELRHGEHSLGGQKKHFKDTLKVSLKAFGISHNSWEQAAMDRPKWQASVSTCGTKYHEANRIVAAEELRQDRKSRVSKSLTAATILSTLHQNLSSTECLQKPSPHPQGQTLQAKPNLDKHKA